MITAAIFDLDGTLVKTEQLKALSYARAAMELRPDTFQEADLLRAFKDVVGMSRQDVALMLLQRFGLEEAARARMTEFGVGTPWQAFVQIRLDHYEAMLADTRLLCRSQWPHNVALLHEVRAMGCKVGLATMSHCSQTQRVLKLVGLSHAFDFVATRDDVEHGKPDPEIYLLVARELDVLPHECLVVEDSPAGVKAALNAGMYVAAVSTPLTGDLLHASGLLAPEHIVDDPSLLRPTVTHVIADHQRIELEASSGDRQGLRQHRPT